MAFTVSPILVPQRTYHHPAPSSSAAATATTTKKELIWRRKEKYFTPTSSNIALVKLKKKQQIKLQMNQNNDNDEPILPNTYDGLNNGKIILTFVVSICIWLFTIPPEFRRAYICPAEIYCIQDSTVCEKDCTTWNEWFHGIGEYYKNGGGIQFDFSIDPKTLEKNEQKLNSLRKGF